MNRYSLALLSLTVASMPIVALAAEQQTINDITFITGGIGDEELNSMKAVKNDYNLSIVNSGKAGAYVNDTHLVISNNGSSVLDTTVGPLLYVQLPAGKYTIDAERNNGRTMHKEVTVTEGKHSTVDISWQ